jgi:hypothetical protein
VTTLHIDIDGDERAALNLLETGIRAKDLRPAARKIRDVLTDGNKRNFSSRGAYFGSTWPPLAASTLERGGGTIGVRSGALKASLEGGRGRKTSATKTQVKVGTKVPHAHLFAGGTRGARRSVLGFTAGGLFGRSGGQPPRPIVGATSNEIREANTIIRRWVTEGH